MSARIFTVREITDRVTRLLETEFPFVWVKGEVSNCSRPSSGHCYFALKDADALINVVWFRHAQRAALPDADGVDPLTGEVLETGLPLADRLENGMAVLVGGGLGVYGPRGQYQLVAEMVQEEGLGDLHAQFEALKARFAVAGYFAPERKRPLPALAARVALVTAPESAAYHDFVTLAAHRGPPAHIRVYPSLVQGDAAPRELAAAIRAAGRDRWTNPQGDRVPFAQVIVVARGGGSLEDLWAFNAEAVATAIFEAPVPVLAGVGHEVDFTIADMTADVRAATPSHAAQLLWPERSRLVQDVDSRELALVGAMRRDLERRLDRLGSQERALTWLSPATRLHEKTARLAETARRLHRLGERLSMRENERLDALAARLRRVFPQARLVAGARREQEATARLERAAHGRLAAAGSALAHLETRLAAVNPAAPLERGYCLARRPGETQFVRSAAALETGGKLEIIFKDDAALTRVEAVSSACPLDILTNCTPRE